MREICKVPLCILLAAGLTLNAQSDKPATAAPDSAVTCAPAPLPDAPAPAGQTGGQLIPASKAKVADLAFDEVAISLFSASAADAEALYRCNNCTVVRSALHRRGVTYGLGLPIDAAVTYMAYRAKKKGHRFWFVSAVALTAANAYLSYHWASSTD
jgi:hypothetical protein